MVNSGNSRFRKTVIVLGSLVVVISLACIWASNDDGFTKHNLIGSWERRVPGSPTPSEVLSIDDSLGFTYWVNSDVVYGAVLPITGELEVSGDLIKMPIPFKMGDMEIVHVSQYQAVRHNGHWYLLGYPGGAPSIRDEDDWAAQFRKVSLFRKMMDWTRKTLKN